tara:strand:+ start:176 stop:418 length:243 start_codon:yes stop_codon:yes gene_type:complete
MSGTIIFANFTKYMKLFLITFTLLAIAFAGIAIKIWAKKGGEFGGTCASQSPFLKKDNESCSYCGKLPSEQNCRTNPQHN